jgi:hypothetical protein
MRRPQPLPDPAPSLADFEGIINARRRKDFGYGALSVGRNVEVTDTKKLVRRNGYALEEEGGYVGLYGSQTQRQLIGVKEGQLLARQPDGTNALLQTGMLGDAFSWDEDPANNIYYTSNAGDNGIVLATSEWLPLSLMSPEILEVAVVDTAPWAVTPFNLGKTYDANVVQLFATYLYSDGRESAPSDCVTVQVAPEVKLLRMQVPLQAGCFTQVYATTPGGSTYFLVAAASTPVFTFPVYFLTQSYTGPDYPFTPYLSSFPTSASLLAFYAGRLFAATTDDTSKLGAVYSSLPLQYHLFDFVKNMFQVSGSPLLLLPHKNGLIIGTDSNIYNYREPDEENQKDIGLTQLAEYGVPPGVCGDVAMDGTAYFWTLRGVAKAMPYELVTEHRFYGDPGVFNHARIFYERGYAKLVASTVAGAPTFNKWTERT